MNLFDTVKTVVPVRQAAEHYGLRVSHSGMACCPFHDDRRPSLKLNEDYFFCFGCGATGDVIDFTAKLHGMSSYEAAKMLAADFGVQNEEKRTVPTLSLKKHPHIRQFREDELFCSRVLTDYLHLLEKWKRKYAPGKPGDKLDDRFVEACQMLEDISYLADVLTVGSLEERTALVDNLMKTGRAQFLKDYVSRKAQEEDVYERTDLAV